MEADSQPPTKIYDAATPYRPESKTPATPGNDNDTVDFPADADAEASSAPVKVLRVFGDYELLEQLGEGGMGVVYKARQRSLNRLVALKMILAGELASPGAVERFYAEATAAASLEHPQIVRVYEVGEADGQHFFSMAYIEGTTLHQACQSGPLPTREAASIMALAARAIQNAHAKGIVHRDIKPANILLDTRRQPRVTDFGLVKDLAAKDGLTITGQVLGTPGFMPPEQARGDSENIGPLADVYALGATLYATLTGRPPFQSARPVDTLKQVIEDSPVSPRQRNPAVSKDLETICLKCLRKDPESRYATAGDLADDLYRWLDNLPIVARPLSTFGKLRMWCRRKPAIAVSLAVILLTVAVAIGVVLRQRADNEQGIRENNRKQARSHVENALAASASGVPKLLSMIRELPDEALPVAREKFADPGIFSGQKLRAALILAELGEPQTEFVVDSIAGAAEGECANIVNALKQDGSAVAALEAAISEVQHAMPADDRTEARLAIVAFQLGGSHAAEDMCRRATDETRRTVFIATLPVWHGNLRQLWALTTLQQSVRLKSAVLAGVGQIPVEEVPERDVPVWQTLIETCYLKSPDSLLHSTAGWMLDRWNLPRPEIAATPTLVDGHQWHVNKHGMTMILIPAGSFQRDGRRYGSPETNCTITLTRPFLLADSEVSTGLFEKFLNDTSNDGEKPENRALNADLCPKADPPACQVSWNDAVTFCNWLSFREGFPAAYTREDMNWQWDPTSDGYRLTTDAEWEYAYRAGTTTDFPMSVDENHLPMFVVMHETMPQICGSRLPHGWGVFDQAGNVAEWCYDYYERLLPASPRTDPSGPDKGLMRTTRGGSCRNLVGHFRIDRRSYNSPTSESPDIGFRVARTPRPSP